MTTIAALVQTLCQSRLLDPAQIDKLTRQLQHRFADPQALADDLIRRGWLTPQQVYPLLQNGSPQPMSYTERRGPARPPRVPFYNLRALAAAPPGCGAP